MDYSKTLEESKIIISECMQKAFLRPVVNNEMTPQERAQHSIEVAEFIALYIEKVLRAVEVTHLIRDQLKDLAKQKELVMAQAANEDEEDGPPQ